jgi:hypothetical protein
MTAPRSLLVLGLFLVLGCGTSGPTLPGSSLPATATTVATASPAPSPAKPSATPGATLPPAAVEPCPGSDSTPGAAEADELRSTHSLWAGAVAVAKKPGISCVEARWFQPKSRCAINATDAVFVGIGIDGYADLDPKIDVTDRNLMLGVETFCSDGGRIKPIAWKWTGNEILDIPLSGIRVAPEDVLWARITFADGGFDLTIIDLTNGTSATATTTLDGAKRQTAEWVISTLQTCTATCKATPLANFDTIRFEDAALSLDSGYRAPLADDRWMRVRLALAPDRVVLARGGQVGGDTFVITWLHR